MRSTGADNAGTHNTLEEWSQQRKLLKFIKFTQWQHIWIKIRLVLRLVIRTKILNTVKYSIFIIHLCPFRTRT